MPQRPPPDRQTPPRQGPRPLAVHLMTHASTMMGSRVALPLWRNGSLPWKPDLAAAAESLRQSVDAAGPQAWAELDRALALEGLARHERMLAGIEAYRRHPWHRDLAAMPALWREGTTSVLDYRSHPDGVPVLVIPSLVNRGYILDLTERRSLMRYFAGRGLAPFLVDWDCPGPAEAVFGLTEYMARLERALERVRAETGRPVAVLGYCMGGDLALALALARPALVSALVLLATPWDFHAGQQAQTAFLNALADPVERIISAAGQLPVDVMQAMFSSLDIGLAARKFAVFARLPQRSARARDFVALEDWANDGVPLAGAVARECLFQWYGENATAKGDWRVGGRAIDPGQIVAPTLVVVPAHDRIVPPQSAEPLLMAIPGARRMVAHGGHVGMLLSRRAKTDLYGPIARWLLRARP